MTNYGIFAPLPVRSLALLPPGLFTSWLVRPWLIRPLAIRPLPPLNILVIHY